MNAVDAISVHPVPARRWRLARLPAAIMVAVATWARLGRESNQLLAMGERDLRDLTLSRIDAVHAARAPRWPSVKAAFRRAINPEE